MPWEPWMERWGLLPAEEPSPCLPLSSFFVFPLCLPGAAWPQSPAVSTHRSMTAFCSRGWRAAADRAGLPGRRRLVLHEAEKPPVDGWPALGLGSRVCRPVGLARRGPRESSGTDSEASNRERCLALIVGQLRGVGRRTQPEFSQDVSSSRGARWIQVVCGNESVTPGEAILVRGACSGTWHPEFGAQQEFLGSCPSACAHSYSVTTLTDWQHSLVSVSFPHLVPGWAPDPCGPCRQVCPGKQRGCLWGPWAWSKLL